VEIFLKLFILKYDQFFINFPPQAASSAPSQAASSAPP
jgi:hypothetical protein